MTTTGPDPALPGDGKIGAAADQPLHAPNRTWVSDSIDGPPPAVARIDDHLLGGFNTFTVDRNLTADLTTVWPGLAAHTFGRRELLERMTAHLVHTGVRQFLDLGCGLLRAGAIHDIAAEHTTEPVRTIYIDADPITVIHNTTHLTNHPEAHCIGGDLCDPDTFLQHPTLTQVLDNSQPVAVLLIGVLDHIPPNPGWTRILDRLLAELSPGSYLGATHLIPGPELTPVAEQVTDLYAHTPTSLHLRNLPDTTAMWRDLHTRHRLTPIEPGLVPAHTWHPDPGNPPTPSPDLYTALTRLEPAGDPPDAIRPAHIQPPCPFSRARR